MPYTSWTDLASEKIGKLRPDDLEVTEKHVQKLFQRFSVSEPVEVYDLVDRVQLDVTTDVFFGESANSLSSEPPFRASMDVLLPVNTARMLFGLGISSQGFYNTDKDADQRHYTSRIP